MQGTSIKEILLVVGYDNESHRGKINGIKTLFAKMTYALSLVLVEVPGLFFSALVETVVCTRLCGNLSLHFEVLLATEAVGRRSFLTLITSCNKR